MERSTSLPKPTLIPEAYVVRRVRRSFCAVHSTVGFLACVKRAQRQKEDLSKLEGETS